MTREWNGAAGEAAAQWNERQRGAGGNRRGAAAPSANSEWNGAGGEAATQWNERKRGAGGNRRGAAAPSAN